MTRGIAGLDRDDFKAARAGAKLRTLDVRHGNGDRGRVVKLGALGQLRTGLRDGRCRPRRRSWAARQESA